MSRTFGRHETTKYSCVRLGSSSTSKTYCSITGASILRMPIFIAVLFQLNVRTEITQRVDRSFVTITVTLSGHLFIFLLYLYT